MSSRRSILTSLLLGAGLSVLLSSCVLTSHVDPDTLRHRNSQESGEEESNGRRTWTGEGTPEFAFKVNDVYYCCNHGEGSHEPHYSYDLELLNGQEGMYSLYWWLDGSSDGSALSLDDGTPVQQGDSVSLAPGVLRRLNLPAMSPGDSTEHTFTLAASYRGFEKTLSIKYYQGYPVLSIGGMRQNQGARRTSYRLYATEDLGEGSLYVYVDGKKSASIWTGAFTSKGNPLSTALTRDDYPQLYLDRYTQGEHELTVRFDCASGRSETAVARWTEPDWGEDEPEPEPDPDPDPDPEPEPEPEPDPDPEPEPEPTAPYKFTFECLYDYNNDRHVCEVSLLEGDDGPYRVSVFIDGNAALEQVWDYGTLEPVDLTKDMRLAKDRPVRFVLPEYDPGNDFFGEPIPGFDVIVRVAAGGYDEGRQRYYYHHKRFFEFLEPILDDPSGHTLFPIKTVFRPGEQLRLYFYVDFIYDYTLHSGYLKHYYGVTDKEEEDDDPIWDSQPLDYQLYWPEQWPENRVRTFKLYKYSESVKGEFEDVPAGEHTLAMRFFYTGKPLYNIDDDGYMLTYLYRWTEPKRN